MGSMQLGGNRASVIETCNALFSMQFLTFPMFVVRRAIFVLFLVIFNCLVSRVFSGVGRAKARIHSQGKGPMVADRYK